MGGINFNCADRHMLVSLNYGRTRCWDGAHQMRILYDMEKLTPFGLIRAEQSVAYAEIIHTGHEVMDGRMFQSLSASINREEMARVLEAGATAIFGSKAA